LLLNDSTAYQSPRLILSYYLRITNDSLLPLALPIILDSIDWFTFYKMMKIIYLLMIFHTSDDFSFSSTFIPNRLLWSLKVKFKYTIFAYSSMFLWFLRWSSFYFTLYHINYLKIINYIIKCIWLIKFSFKSQFRLRLRL